MARRLGKGEQTSGLKSKLENHPALVAAGFFGAGLLFAYPILTAVYNNRFEATADRHRAEIERLSAKHERELKDKTYPLEQKIADQNFRLSSIERRLPGSGPTYLDVSSLIIGPEAVKSLGKQYTSFDQGRFYVAVPKMTDWNYRLTNSFDLNKSFFEFQKYVHPLVKQAQLDTKVYVWENNFQLNVSFQGNADNNPYQFSFHFHPMIIVETFESEMF